MKRLLIAITVLIFFSTSTYAFKLVNREGLGSRSSSLANNYVALSNDFSGIFWNPAALSFVPVREFTVSTGLLQKTTDWKLGNGSGVDELLRMRLSEIGFLFSIPTSRGGLTFGLGYASPWTFDDISAYEGSYTYNDTTIFRKSDYRTFGNLGLIGFSMGVQVAKGIGVGLTVSPVIGREHTRSPLQVITTYGSTRTEAADIVEYEGQYFGYDIRGGILASLMDNRLRLGARASIPRVIKFTETQQIFTKDEQLIESLTYDGSLISSFEGAMGAAYTFPFATISGEIRGRAPYSIVFPDRDIPVNGAGSSRMGAGIGAEIPLLFAPLVARGGVSWDEVDLFRFVRKENGFSHEFGNDNVVPESDQFLFTLGLGYVSSSIQVSGAWGYQSRTQKSINPGVTLEEDLSSQRGSLTFSLRF